MELRFAGKLSQIPGVWYGQPLFPSESCFLVVKPSKIIFLIYNTIPQKVDIILLYIGYHTIPM